MPIPFIHSALHDASPNGAQNLDLEAFEGIVSRPNLAACVKELLFDASQFVQDISKSRYFERLFRRSNDLSGDSDIWGPNSLNCFDPRLFKEVDPEIIDLGRRFQSTAVLYGDFESYDEADFINEGYCQWLVCAKKQKERMSNPEVAKVFAAGLSKIKGVKSIVLACGWSVHPDKRKVHHGSETVITPCTGSPFARSWSVFRPKPYNWKFALDDSTEVGLAPSDGFLEFTFVSNALSSADVHPSKLSVGSIDISKDRSRSQDTHFGYGEGIRPLLESGDWEMLRVLDNVYQNLTHLSLHMATIDHVDLPRLMPNLRGLGQLLYSLTKLESLDLRLPLARCDSLPLWGNQNSYDQVFERKDGRWPKLHTLILHNIAVGTRDLVSLFSNGLPILRTLALSSIKLLDGKWEWLIEFMHQKMVLDLMSQEYGTTLLYPCSSFYGDDKYTFGLKDEQYSKVTNAVSAYAARKDNFHPSVDEEEDKVLRGQLNARLTQLYSEDLEDFLQSKE
ncbi:MAG: hypothetical protein Q9221_007170 [Calogaya cf. arnoldii]